MTDVVNGSCYHHGPRYYRTSRPASNSCRIQLPARSCCEKQARGWLGCCSHHGNYDIIQPRAEPCMTSVGFLSNSAPCQILLRGTSTREWCVINIWMNKSYLSKGSAPSSSQDPTPLTLHADDSPLPSLQKEWILQRPSGDMSQPSKSRLLQAGYHRKS